MRWPLFLVGWGLSERAKERGRVRQRDQRDTRLPDRARGLWHNDGKVTGPGPCVGTLERLIRAAHHSALELAHAPDVGC